MIFSINYIVYIIYSFLVLFVLYVCLQIYKKYSFYIYKPKEKLFSSEKYLEKKKNKIKTSSNTSNKLNNLNNLNNLNKIRDLKKKFKIKSTEKTFEDIILIANKPNYININNSNNSEHIINIIINDDFIKKIKNYKNDNNIQEITKKFLSTKQEFYNTFVNTETDEYFIRNLNDFYLFYKTIINNSDNHNNLNNHNNTNISNSNILLKFYNNDLNEYIYVFVSKNKMTKIVYNDDYNNISNMIEKNNGIFILTNNNKEYYIGYGSYTQSEIDLTDIKNILFSNINDYHTDKNYKLFSKFKFIKIYFYICNKII